MNNQIMEIIQDEQNKLAENSKVIIAEKWHKLPSKEIQIIILILL